MYFAPRRFCTSRSQAYRARRASVSVVSGPRCSSADSNGSPYFSASVLTDRPTVRLNTVIDVGDHEGQSELARRVAQQIEQGNGIYATRDRDQRLPGIPEEPIFANVRQHARRQRGTSGHVS